ncbi:TetR/AcrR family transcriptional regulator [Kribbella qitaiheensis]|uniref:TetR/AcrR family transcriptional regulator n=1 Tax=Kribbella qitaiheensis TaxID=1544730 RepID=A0A7G6X169_9ACTN|nr:TetR/AcrR family transcriptional regulator [Kribbella qitaiheensis]QNE19984.1 TetR/AcrR family transcriptional regulator [Kribbella qitaiheensis]
MNAGRTARDRARAELTQEIKDAARRQLAAEGAERLSLRAVSRELGMVSSALYRYFPSRDDLLTALIIDAYDALGVEAEKVGASGQDPRAAWIAVCHAVRDWAKSHQHEYTLIYGSPIAGYQAPQTTIQPASRVAIMLLGLLAKADGEGVLDPGEARECSGVLAEQVKTLEELAPGVPVKVLTRTMVAWTQLFGMISFELYGQLVGTMDPADAFFADTVEQMADFVGLREPAVN